MEDRKYKRSGFSDKARITNEKVLAELAQVGFHQVPEVKDATKVRALELMGKHLGMFEQESSGPRVQIVLEGRDLLL